MTEENKEFENYPYVHWQTFAAFYKQSEAALHAVQQISIRAYAKAFNVPMDEASAIYTKLYETELAKSGHISQ